jgi:hypothetical protein
MNAATTEIYRAGTVIRMLRTTDQTEQLDQQIFDVPEEDHERKGLLDMTELMDWEA